jgi:predicted dehydrogenase
MKWKVAICGLGVATQSIHLPAYQKLSDIQVVGGFDPAAGVSSFPFPLFDSIEQMITTTQPDIVLVATPTDSHYESTSKALEAGCHVLCEKPFMASIEQARKVIELAEKCAI